jgi:hypothetical protein
MFCFSFVQTIEIRQGKNKVKEVQLGSDPFVQKLIFSSELSQCSFAVRTKKEEEMQTIISWLRDFLSPEIHGQVEEIVGGGLLLLVHPGAVLVQQLHHLDGPARQRIVRFS